LLNPGPDSALYVVGVAKKLASEFRKLRPTVRILWWVAAFQLILVLLQAFSRLDLF
jgi:hypothetical protein